MSNEIQTLRMISSFNSQSLSNKNHFNSEQSLKLRTVVSEDIQGQIEKKKS